MTTFIHSCSFLENHTRFQTKWAKCIPVFRPKRPKTRAFGAAHTSVCMANIREYPPPGHVTPVKD